MRGGEGSTRQADGGEGKGRGETEEARDLGHKAMSLKNLYGGEEGEGKKYTTDKQERGKGRVGRPEEAKVVKICRERNTKRKQETDMRGGRRKVGRS